MANIEISNHGNSAIPGVGMNMSRWTYYYPNFPRSNMVEIATGGWGNDDNVTFDSTLHPIALNGDTPRIRTYQMGDYPDANYHRPEENHVLLWDGGACTWSISGHGGSIISSITGRIEISMPTSGGQVILDLDAIDENDPPKNIAFVPTRFEDTYKTTDKWHPDFVSRLQPFNVLRFMNWLEITQRDGGCPIANYGDFHPENYIGQNVSLMAGNSVGVSLSYIVDICNTTNSDCWICLPHLITDQAATSAAEYFLANLNANLRVWIEYSNECWNTGAGWIAQKDYCTAQAALDENITHGAEFYGLRAAQLFQKFEDVFGGLSRLRRVIAWQNASPTWGETILDFEHPSITGSVASHTDVYATAPYTSRFIGSTEDADAFKLETITDVIASLQAEMDDETRLARRQESVAVATDRGLLPACYECGLGLLTNAPAQNDEDTVDHCVSMHVESAMGNFMTDYLNVLRRDGFKQIMIYSDLTGYDYGVAKFGPWGQFPPRETTL